MANRYWSGAGGTWDTTSTTGWSATSGGGAGASVPTSSDDVFIDANASGNITTATGAVCKSLNFTGYTHLFTLGDTLDVYGSVTFVSGMTSSLGYKINIKNATGTATFTMSTATPGRIDMQGAGTLSPGDAWGYAPFYLQTAGTFNANGFNTQFSYFAATAGTVTLGTTTATTTGEWDTETGGVTITSSGYTVKCNGDYFRGGSKAYNNLWLSGSGYATTTITGSNTFADLKCDKSIANTIKFAAGTTQTVTTFTVNGTVGNLCSLDSTTTGTHTLSKASGTVNCDYLSIQHSVATGGATWNATNSTNNQAVATAGSGWNITGPASASNSLFFGSPF